MTNCKEFPLDDLMAITAIPVADIPASDTTSPVNTLTPTISRAAFYPTLAHAVTIGRTPLDLTPSGGVQNRAACLVPIRRLTGKAKDEESDSVAGRLHTVTATCEADERDGTLWAPVTALSGAPCSLHLERTPCHLVLQFRDGTLGFATATPDTYLCTIDRDGAKVNIQFRLQNWLGIQMIE